MNGIQILQHINEIPNGYVDSVNHYKADGIICTLMAIENDLIIDISLFENTLLIENFPSLVEEGIRCIKE